MTRAFLVLTLLLVAACGQTNITFPPCFPFCGGGGGGGSNPPRPPSPEVQRIEILALPEAVEASPGTLGTYVSLPIRVRLQGDPGTYYVYLNAITQASPTHPGERLVLGQATLEMGSGEERGAEVSLWVGPGWPPGDYPSYLEATASHYSGQPVRRPFTLRVR